MEMNGQKSLAWLDNQIGEMTIECKDTQEACIRVRKASSYAALIGYRGFDT